MKQSAEKERFVPVKGKGTTWRVTTRPETSFNKTGPVVIAK